MISWKKNGGVILKKEYQTPEIHLEEYELENTAGNLCSSNIGGLGGIDEE